MDHFWLIYVAVFIDEMFLYSYVYKKNACPYFTCISDFVGILATRYCKPFMTSAYNLSGKSKQLKKLAVKLVTTKKETFRGIINIFIFYVGP